jgi:[histone H3]-lysine79 N-trimethyltransferase
LQPKSVATSSKSSPRPSPKPGLTRPKSASPYPSSSDEKRLERKRKVVATASAVPRKSPASDRIAFDADSDAEDEDDWVGALDVRKRQRTSDGRLVDEKRILPNSKSFKAPERPLKLINAADVASLRLKCVPQMGARVDEVKVKLQYPSMQQPEE